MVVRLVGLAFLWFCSLVLIGQESLEKQLWEAAGAGDREKVVTLLDQGVDVNAPNEQGATALIFAANKQHHAMVDLLLERGADPNAKDRFYEMTPIIAALNNNDFELMKKLVVSGAKDIQYPLILSIFFRNQSLLQTILEHNSLTRMMHRQAMRNPQSVNDENLRKLLESANVIDDPPAIELNRETLTPLVGRYRVHGQEFELQITLQNDRLAVVLEDKTIPLEAYAAERFRGTGDDPVTIDFRGRGGSLEMAVLFDGILFRQYRKTFEEQEQTLAGSVADKPETRRVEPKRANHWPSFRGPGASGVADGEDLPVQWDIKNGKNIRWKQTIPGLAHASPVVWGDQVFVVSAVSSAGDDKLTTGLTGTFEASEDLSKHSWVVYALDASSGEIRWEKEAGNAKPRIKRHVKASQANSTPATEGRYLVTLFPTLGLVCYDLNGNLQWRQDLGVLDSGWFYDPSYQWGFASSPIIFENKVIVQADLQENSFIAAFDLTSGKELWRTARDEQPTWSTPSVFAGPKGHELVTNGTVIRAYDPQNGKELWRAGPNSKVIIATPIMGEENIYVSAGYPPVKPIYAFMPGARGDLTGKVPDESEHLAWQLNHGGAYMPTPLVYRGLLYFGHHDGRLAVYEAATGKRVYRARLGSGGTLTGSPVASDGKIFFPMEDGTVYVIAAGAEYKELATNQMNETVMTTPAIAKGALYIRTRAGVVAIGK